MDKPPRKEVRKNMKSIKNILKQKKYSVKPQAEPKAKSLDIWNGKRELIIKHDSFLKGYAQVPNPLLADLEVSDAAVRLWGIMYRFDHSLVEIFVKVETLEEITGKSIKQIRRLLAELVKAGWIKLESYKMHRRNVYTLGWPTGTQNPKKQKEIQKQMADEKRR